MKVWISKYALTSGIREVEVRDAGNGMVVKDSDWNTGEITTYYHGEGRDWHRTEVEALERAVEMAARRTNSLKKSLSKNERVTHRLVLELQAARTGQAKPSKPAKKMTKKQLETLERESKDQQLADEQAEADRMND